MKKTYSGSCHCGRVKFEADIDFTGGTGKCNCSICAKSRYWGIVIKPEAFRLLQGEHELSDYQFKSDDPQFGWKRGRSEFCRYCGIRPFGRGDVPELGGAFVSVNIAVLDDVDVSEFFDGPLRYADGRHDNWQNPPAETRHL
ncbi:MAG TPA: GFA family protein [Aestuariivirga sp.]|jgi:hypothetical protein|nr:GFA family protein [Aestuariivirga sp.]